MRLRLRLRTYWYEAPATDKGSKQLTAPNIDILGRKGHEIVGRADRVGGDVDTKSDDDQADGGEGGSSAAAGGSRFHP